MALHRPGRRPSAIDAKAQHGLRPLSLTPEDAAAPTLQLQEQHEALRALLKDGMRPADIAGQVCDAIRNDTFYIVPAQPGAELAIDTRLQDIRLRRNPTIAPRS